MRTAQDTERTPTERAARKARQQILRRDIASTLSEFPAGDLLEMRSIPVKACMCRLPLLIRNDAQAWCGRSDPIRFRTFLLALSAPTVAFSRAIPNNLAEIGAAIENFLQ